SGSEGRAYLVRVGATSLEGDEALAAARSLAASDPTARVVLHGGSRPEAPVHERVGWCPGAPPAEADVPAWDGVADPREPGAGSVLVETLRWISAGIPVAVADFPGYDDLPRETPIRVPAAEGGGVAARALRDRAPGDATARAAMDRVAANHTHAAEARA